MSTTTATMPETTSSTRPEWSVWTCPNCRYVTQEPRKRCRECGTSRY